MLFGNSHIQCIVPIINMIAKGHEQILAPTLFTFPHEAHLQVTIEPYAKRFLDLIEDIILITGFESPLCSSLKLYVRNMLVDRASIWRELSHSEYWSCYSQ